MEIVFVLFLLTLSLSTESIFLRYRYTDIKSVSIVGGQNIEEQAFALRQGVQLIIATPGRLQDCLERSYLVLNQCNYIVLDEADRMIDMGFEPQVVAIFESMGDSALKSEDPNEAEKQAEAEGGKKRTTIMFSATMPPAVENLAGKYLRAPAIIKIGDKDSGKNKLITQKVVMCSEGAKFKLLQKHLRSAEAPIIVFANSRKGCDAVYKKVKGFGFKVCKTHERGEEKARLECLFHFPPEVLTNSLPRFFCHDSSHLGCCVAWW